MSANGKTKLLTPQQREFWAFYNDKASKTYNNAHRSALQAGYGEEYSRVISSRVPDWMSEIINGDRRKRMLDKAESVLEESLDWKEKYLKIDTAKFITKTQGKTVGYSERSEITGANGSDLSITIQQYKPSNSTQNIPNKTNNKQTTGKE